MKVGTRGVITLGLSALALMLCKPAPAATPEEIEASIDAGVAWLVAQQNPDGSWEGGANISPTSFAVLKLEDRAFELGFDSPFDSAYPYHEAVEAGLAFILANGYTMPISVQPAGDPDSDGDGVGVYFVGFDGHRTYDTGIAMMAIAASRAPGRVVTAAGCLTGWTFRDVLQDTMDYLAYGQLDVGAGVYQGGWGYTDNMDWADNSNSGYAVLGLAYAQEASYGFNLTIAGFVKDELSLWCDYIQHDGGDDDGGSGYDDPNWWVNLLKTGNLMFEMTFVGDELDASRVQRALAYIGRKWDVPGCDPGWQGPPPHYQATYCLMKGLSYAGIPRGCTIDVGGSDVDWYDEFATAIVAHQLADGSWYEDCGWGGPILDTEWALLTLEAIAPPTPVEYASSGTNLFGAGTQDTTILYDVQTVPPEAGIGFGLAAASAGSAAAGGAAQAPDFDLDLGEPGAGEPRSARAGEDRVSATEKGSLLVYPKVEIRWNSAGELIQDTFVTINNDLNGEVDIQMYFVSESCTNVDNVITLTENEPTYWSVLTGMPKGVSPWTVLGAPYPDPDGSGDMIMRGYVLAWAIDEEYAQIRWNHLYGGATIVNYADTSAWEYNAYAFQVVDGNVANGDPVGTAGVLNLDGVEYDNAFALLLLDFFASGSTAFSGGGNSVLHDTDLTLLIVSNDLRQDGEGPNTTKAKFDIWNENEVGFSGMEYCITKWDESLLSNHGGHFLVENLQTAKGRARITGLESTVCLESTDQALLGVAAKLLTFN